jgi:hypothetical protein
MQYIKTHYITIILALLTLASLTVAILSYRTAAQTRGALTEVVTVLGQSGILTKGSEEEIIINRVVRLVDLENVQNGG